MEFLLGVFFLESIISGLLCHSGFDIETISIFCVVINTLLFFYLLIRLELFDKNICGIIFCVYILRLGLLFFDIYGINLFRLPHSGGDSEAFNYHALLVYNGVRRVSETPLGFYPKMLSCYYLLAGPSRLMAQYFNLICSMFVIKYLYKTLRLLRINKKALHRCMLILCFFPQLNIFSVILLREVFVTLGLCISLYFFIRWYTQGNFSNFLFANVWVLIGCLFHPGIFPFAIVYILTFSLLNRKAFVLNVSFSSISVLIFCVAAFLILVLTNPDIFLDKFNVSNSNEVMTKLNYSEASAGSSYLTWININDPLEIILFSPLKILYFLFSPMVWDIRGLGDIMGITLDSFVYMYLVFNIIRYKACCIQDFDRTLYRILALSVFLTTFLYAFGTIASGTAIRHRSKLICCFVLLYGVIMNCYYKRER